MGRHMFLHPWRRLFAAYLASGATMIPFGIAYVLCQGRGISGSLPFALCVLPGILLALFVNGKMLQNLPATEASIRSSNTYHVSFGKLHDVYGEDAFIPFVARSSSRQMSTQITSSSRLYPAFENENHVSRFVGL
jgi:hypothetical protein